jgi:hypothetical protein
VEESFRLLEDKIHKAAKRLKALHSESESLRAEALKERARAEKAEKELAAAASRGEVGEEEARKREALAREVADLRAEREEVRRRLARLLELLEGL